jgi:transposase
MSKTKSTQARGKYTLEFKLEAVRLVRKGQSVAVTAKTLGIPGQTLDNWMRLQAKGALQGAGDRPVTAEQMELARLRAENARLKMEHEILKKAAAYFARESL